MRGVALGLCVGAVAMFAAASVNAAPFEQGFGSAGNSTPASINDHDGGFIPKGEDKSFAINPDGPQAANYSGNADQDEDGSDIAIYQGEDDQLPS